MLDNLTRRFTGIFSGLAGKKITESSIKETTREIRRALLEADAALPVVKEFVKRVGEKALGAELVAGVDAGQMFIKIVNDELIELMGPVDPEIAFKAKGPTVVLLSGLQGSGKTTTCAKLALFLRDRKKRKPMMVAADLQRPAAIDQLKVLGGQIGVPVFHEEGLSPPELCEKAVQEAKGRGCDTVLLDTAGRLHVDEELMGEIRQIAKCARPDEIFLVCDAMTGQDAVQSVSAFNESLELSGVILTKLDGDARGGAALSIMQITNKPIKFVGVGEKLDRLEEFHPDRMASRILGMGDVVGLVDRAQLVIDEEEQERLQKKMLEANFDLDDFLGQLAQVKKMGSIKDLLGHLPGLGGRVDELDLKGNELTITESIIQSMTQRERSRPEIINTNRRKRIARGAGRSVEQVNDLLRQFKQMQGMMKQFSQTSGFMGKLKGMKEMKKQLGATSAEQMMQGLGSGPGGLAPGGPGATGPGMGPGGGGGGSRGGGPTKEEIRKRRKKERQRKKRSRRR